MTAIVANGEFPRKGGKAREILADAARVVACDGAADAFVRALKRAPDFIVGDLDSLRRRPAGCREIVRVAEQETNDLAKAVRFCRERGWRDLAIFGAAGKRDDHALGNVFLAMELGIPVVTDYGRFTPVDGEISLSVQPGTPVSVFATSPDVTARSEGLEWPLSGVVFRNLYCATLNRACAPLVRISASGPLFVYVPFAGRRG